MLKNPSKIHHESFIDSSPLSKMSPMTDEQVEAYIDVLFKKSPRASSGTAPAYDWLQFINKFNEQQNYYVLTDLQRRAIKPYCEMNPDLEMTPQEFIKLLFITRQQQHVVEEPRPRTSASTPATRRLFNSRPRSSRIMSSRSSSYFDDRASVNHPDTNMNDRTTGATRSENNNNEEDEENNVSLLKTLRKEKSMASRQLREYESRVLNLSKEHTERISQLQTRLENMKIEAEQQKLMLAEQKNKERDRLEKITELLSTNDQYERQHAIDLKKLQKKSEDLESLREKMNSLQVTHEITLANLKAAESELSQAREMNRVHEKEKADLHMQLEHERIKSMDARQELEAQQTENVKLMGLIDRQKFDLDEARSGLRYYSSTPPLLDKKSSSSHQSESDGDADTETSLAHEQIEAEYSTKLKALEDERDTYKQQAEEIKQQWEEAEAKISDGLDQQIHLIDDIARSVSSGPPSRHQRTYQWVTFVSLVPWLFFLYHTFLTVFYYLADSKQTNTIVMYPFNFMHTMDEFFLKRFGEMD